MRWFHTGGIFAALSETTPDVIEEAMAAAARHGTVVSYDLNYRPSLWKALGGSRTGRARSTASSPRHVDVMLGNEEDFTACLGFEVEGVDENLTELDTGALPSDDRAGGRGVPELQGRRHHAPRRPQRDASTTGAPIAWSRDGGFAEATPTPRISRSSTASAAATASPPA